MKRLTATETATALRDNGLDRPSRPAFAFRDRARATFYDWHAHPNHQLLLALDGVTQIETAQARYFLPLGRAAWIPAGVRHRTLVTDADGTSVYFPREAVPTAGSRVRILVADALMREMVIRALGWPRGAAQKSRLAKSFFETLSLLCAQWLESELPLSLPRASHPALARAMDQVLQSLEKATQARACKDAGMSERTFRRLFLSETGVTWQAWLTQARILKAMALLAEGRRVTEVAADVGYSSLSAFAKAFAQLSGENPARYRDRVAAARRMVKPKAASV
jgi:AraC-like DNA-binding protein